MAYQELGKVPANLCYDTAGRLLKAWLSIAGIPLVRHEKGADKHEFYCRWQQQDVVLHYESYTGCCWLEGDTVTVTQVANRLSSCKEMAP